MSVTEADIELLETYLDGELPITDAEMVWQRTGSEPELSAALEELRGQRAVRMTVWSSMEPSSDKAETVAQRAVALIHRRHAWERLNRGIRYVAAAAAVLFLGFRAGLMERGDGPISQDQQAGYALKTIPANSAPQSGGYPVVVLDSSGHVVAMQRFANQQDAINFRNEWNNANATQLQQPGQTGLGDNVAPASDVQY